MMPTRLPPIGAFLGALAGILLAAAWIVMPKPAMASPFCVAVQGLPDQCIFADGASCQRRASQLNGVCIANSLEVTPAPGPGQFCLVIGNQAMQCVYPDRVSCEADAARRHTACVQTTGQPGSSTIDPFAIRRPY